MEPGGIGNTKGNIIFYSGFAPLVEVSALATAHVEYFTAQACSAATAAVHDGAGGESRMRKTCDHDRLDPVVEIA
jgi:hypothetical protein